MTCMLQKLDNERAQAANRPGSRDEPSDIDLEQLRYHQMLLRREELLAKLQVLHAKESLDLQVSEFKSYHTSHDKSCTFRKYIINSKHYNQVQ